NRTTEPRLGRGALQGSGAVTGPRARAAPVRFAGEPQQHVVDVLTGQIVEHHLLARQPGERVHVTDIDLGRAGSQRTRHRLGPDHLHISVGGFGHGDTLNIGRTHGTGRYRPSTTKADLHGTSRTPVRQSRAPRAGVPETAATARRCRTWEAD